MFLLNEINKLYDSFSDPVYAANILDKKTKELIAVACSVMADCTPCIEWHYQQAVLAGATGDEISEALAISMSVSSGSKRAKFGPVISKLEHEKK
jgi:AhpD family alkylhydroperoxidase